MKYFSITVTRTSTENTALACRRTSSETHSCAKGDIIFFLFPPCTCASSRVAGPSSTPVDQNHTFVRDLVVEKVLLINFALQNTVTRLSGGGRGLNARKSISEIFCIHDLRARHQPWSLFHGKRVNCWAVYRHNLCASREQCRLHRGIFGEFRNYGITIRISIKLSHFLL